MLPRFSSILPALIALLSVPWANPAAVQAQEPISVQTPAQQAAEERILAILAKPYSAKFKKQPLAEVLAEIKRSTGLPIHVDTTVLEEASIQIDAPVSCEVSDISLRSALRQILTPLELAYVIHDEMLLVTTPDAAANLLVTRVYPVQDLVAAKTNPRMIANPQPLIQLITDLVAPTTWEGCGPPPFDFFKAAGTIAFDQTPGVHEQVALLLAALRKARDQQGLNPDAPAQADLTAAQSQAPITVQTAAEQAAEDRIRAILEKPFSVNFRQMPLAKILADIKHSTGLPVRIDVNALADASIALDSPVSCELSQSVSLRTALSLMLEGLHLAWTIQDECLLVTTRDKASNLLMIKVYPVHDLFLDPTNPGVGTYKAIEAFRQQIEDNIALATWDGAGGPGGIDQFNPSQSLVISQTFDVHEQIALLLAKSRKARQP